MTEVWAPRHPEDAQALLRQAQDKGQSILPCGQGTRMHRHGVSGNPTAFLSAKNLADILWLDAADRTCEVQAGIHLDSLQKTLCEHGLEWGVCSPQDLNGTLGGLCLAPDHSFLTSAMGFPRDQILGGQWILADGTMIRTGARVVKSVAGYDLTRLLLGSQGQLAFCLSLVLKLRPRPAQVFWYQCPSEDMPPLPHFGIRHAHQRGDLFTCSSTEKILGLSSQEIPSEIGAHSFEELQELFRTSVARVHFPAPISKKLLCAFQIDALAVDVANRTVAFQNESLARTYQKQMPSSLRIPSLEPFPWVKEIAQAMTPQSRTFHHSSTQHA